MEYNLQYISPEFKKMLNDALAADRQIQQSLSYREYKYATILPFVNWEDSIGGVIDENDALIDEPNKNLWPVNLLLYDLSSKTKAGKTVLYLGFLNTCFGHWFTDNLRKIWFLNDSRYKEITGKSELILAYTTDKKAPLLEGQMIFFDMLGVNLRNAIMVDKPMQFDKVIIPDDAFCNYSECGRQYTPEMVEIWDRLIDHIKVPSTKTYPEKVYLSRTRFQSSKDLGEGIIEKTFKRLGYTIIYPETLPLMEQLLTVRNCKCLAATEGSISHLALFCKPQTQLIVLSKVRWVNTHQLCADEYADLNVTYIEAHRSYRANPKCPWQGPFYMCVTPYLEQFVKIHIPHLPDCLRPDYWVYSRKIWVRAYRWMKRKLILKKG